MTTLTLRPANLSEKKKVYVWLANSNLSVEMFGPPNFPDVPAPTWQEFYTDYQDYYFDGSKPWAGRCFIILYHNEEIGQISYNEIDTNAKSTEIDIWLADRKFTNKGFGPEAIKLLCAYLKETFSCEKVYIGPSKRNKKALKAYKKAGFQEAEKLPNHFLPDYHDTVLLVKFL